MSSEQTFSRDLTSAQSLAIVLLYAYNSLRPARTARGESDADTVDLWALAEILLALVAVAAHFAGCDVFGNRFRRE